MPTEPDREALLRDLAAPLATIAPKFLYDEQGCALFCAITELDEYYPTRTERAILATHAAAIAAALGDVGALIDLGAGDCAKAARLFDVLRPARYVAIDISETTLQSALAALRCRFPEIPMTGLRADLAQPLDLPDGLPMARRVFFYPGSSIGNFAPEAAERFLAGLRSRLDATGALLIGVDLLKDAEVLEAAYDDALGVTAAFDLNVLRHANRIAGTDFAPRDWRHVARFDRPHARVEMRLEALRRVRVGWPGGGREFAAGEAIVTEHSYKYTVDSFTALLARAGFAGPCVWTDARDWFAVFLVRPSARRGWS